jgi:hypothetical protein
MKKTIKKKKTTRKRKKTGISDSLRAFVLVAVIVAFSALISCAVIMVHSSINNDSNDDVILSDEQQDAEPLVELDLPQPPTTEIIDSEPSAVVIGTPPVQETPSTAVAVVQNPRPAEKPKAQGTLVFVIDDAGNNLRELEPFLRVPGALTIAVLPGLPNSAEAARRIRASGKEVILHQPMEAIGAQDPGPQAIYAGMSAYEIRAVLARNIAEIGPVTGINNHQGSKITMDTEAMRTILEFCAENGLYFLDSRTTADSVVPAVARQMGIKIAERNVFIDNEQNKDAMLRYITGGLARAQRFGTAVMIGHTWSPDLASLLSEQFPLFIEQGYTIKTAFELIRGTSEN